jgi:hypothetical protein
MFILEIDFTLLCLSRFSSQISDNEMDTMDEQLHFPHESCNPWSVRSVLSEGFSLIIQEGWNLSLLY